MGGYIFSEASGYVLPEKVANAAEAKIDLKRGVVFTTTKAVAPETAAVFGPASFHENDYPLYYFNIKANIATRIESYKKSAK